jgi:hypothetical protein
MVIYSRKIITVKYSSIEKTGTISNFERRKMSWKKVIVIVLCFLTLLSTLTHNAVARATPEERRTVYSMDFLGLNLSVVAPYLAYPSENVTVSVIAEASGNIDIDYIRVNVYGLRNETEEFSLLELPISEVPHQGDYVISIPNDTSPGLVYGKIDWKWYTESQGMGVTVAPPPAGFVVTYIRSLELEELQVAYHELNSTYNILLANYTGLKSNEDDLGATRNVVYIFVATTIVAAATVLILLLRRPKREW